MFDKIEKLIEDQYTQEDGRIIKYDTNETYICDAIEKLIQSNSDTIKQYSLDCETVFENPGCEYSYLTIAYIESGKLEHFTYILETI